MNRHSLLLMIAMVISLNSFSVNAENVIIKNRWEAKDCYLNAENGTFCSAKSAWVIEPAPQGYMRLKNEGSNCYLNIESGLDCSAIEPGWHSAQWKVETESNGYVRLKSRWKARDCYLNIEDGLNCSAIEPGWHSAQWRLISYRQLQVAYVIPQGETARPRADEAITEIMAILQRHYLQQLGVTFNLKGSLITHISSPLDAKNAVEWDNNFDLIRTEFAEDYIEGENIVFTILEGTAGSAGGSWNIVKMTGGFWNTAYETYLNNPAQLVNQLHGWSHELGHAFGLMHTEDATRPCLAKHGIHLGTLPSLIMQKTGELGSVFNYSFIEEEKMLLLNPDYFPDCRPLLSPPGLEKPHASRHLRTRNLP